MSRKPQPWDITDMVLIKPDGSRSVTIRRPIARIMPALAFRESQLLGGQFDAVEAWLKNGQFVRYRRRTDPRRIAVAPERPALVEVQTPPKEAYAQ